MANTTSKYIMFAAYSAQANTLSVEDTENNQQAKVDETIENEEVVKPEEVKQPQINNNLFNLYKGNGMRI